MDTSLLANALIYLLAAVIAVPLARACGLGAVLGYLLAGIAIGPWGLGLISEVEDIMHFSEFGVVLLLFVIGLELEPQRLWRLRRPIFGWGAAQVGAVTAVLAGAAMLAGTAWQTALVAALGLSLSSTAIALTLMQERNLLPTPAGQAGFSILLFQDLAAIPMIALLPLLGAPEGAGGGAGWQGALKAVGVIAGLVLAGRLLVRPALGLVARAGLREIFTACALALVISIALLMQWAGMSMALGAFLAGVLLADSQYRHELESDLEPFKGLLLGLFFIAVGMSVDLGVFGAAPWRVLGIACAFVALKLAVLYGLSLAFGLKGRQGVLFAFLLSQGGEFAFVVFGAAAAARVLDAASASVLVLAVTLSMMLTPPLLLFYDRVLVPRWQARARKREPDTIEPASGHVIIAGFGRFGQIVGRLLNANQVPLTILDHAPDSIDVVSSFGFKVFYGDATRIELLESAGAAQARALVIAIDGVEDSLKLAAAVRRSYPDLRILARARDLNHCYRLKDLGVRVIERETFDSALMLGRRALEELGFGSYLARQAALRFREHNLRSVREAYPFWRDRERFVSLSRRAREELHDMFERDFVAIRREREDGDD